MFDCLNKGVHSWSIRRGKLTWLQVMTVVRDDCSVNSFWRKKVWCPLESLESEIFLSAGLLFRAARHQHGLLQAGRHQWFLNHFPCFHASIGSEMVWAKLPSIRISSFYYHIEININPSTWNQIDFQRQIPLGSVHHRQWWSWRNHCGLSWWHHLQWGWLSTMLISPSPSPSPPRHDFRNFRDHIITTIIISTHHHDYLSN